MPTALRVVGYARISRADDESTSISRQREIITQTAAARGWDLVDIVEDIDISATKRRLDRPGLTRARAMLADGQAGALLVWRLDRLARSVVDMGTLFDEGIAIVSATEQFDTTTPGGKAMVQILQIFAEMESSTIGLRVASARDYLARNARHPGGTAPYGYRSVPHPDDDGGRALVVVPEEAAHIRTAAQIVLTGGSLYKALQVIREQGSKPHARKRKGDAVDWSLSSLRVVLVGDAILGRIRHRGAVVRGDDGLPLAPWEPILPLADVERLRALLAPKKDPSERRRRATRLLSGLVSCASCGASMRVATSTQTNGSRVLRYACRGSSDGTGCTAPSSVTAPLLDEHVEATFLARFGTWPVIEEIETLRDTPALAEVEAALRDLSAALIRPGADVATLASQVASLHSQREELEAVPMQPVVETIETGRTFAESWAASNTDGRRVLLSGALDAVEVSPGTRGRKGLDTDRVTLHWRYGNPRETGEEDYLAGQFD